MTSEGTPSADEVWLFIRSTPVWLLVKGLRLQFPMAQIHLNKTVDMDKYNFFLQHIYKASHILKLNLLIIFEYYAHH